MSRQAFQDTYDDATSYCYGCGRLNDHGLQIKTHWDGDQTVTVFRPQPQHMALPGFVYGGLIASLFDCHSTGSAAAALYREAGREMGTEPLFRTVTGSLHVDYLKPTPIDGSITIRGTVSEVAGRKVTITSEMFAGDVMTARATVVAISVPADFGIKK